MLSQAFIIFLGALAANRIAGKVSFSRQIGYGFCALLAAALALASHRVVVKRPRKAWATAAI